MRDHRAILGRRLMIAVAFMLLLNVASMLPRLLIYGSAVVFSTFLRVVLFLVELAILVLLTVRPFPPPLLTRAVGAMLFAAASLAMVWIEQQCEAMAPGSVFPPVLYRRPPSLVVSLVSSFIEAIFRVALWTLVYVFPLKLDDARRTGFEAAQLERARALSRMRATVEPALVQRTLDEIRACIEVDPRGARERLAAFAEYLDEHSTDKHEQSAFISDHHAARVPAAFASSESVHVVPTPTLRAPHARQRFAVAVLVIVSLFALSALTRYAEHGWHSLRLDILASVRILIELGVFVMIAERAAVRRTAVTRTIAWTLLVSIAVGLVVTLLQMGLESKFPGFLFPSSIYTHPTPPIRQLMRAVMTSFVDVGFWTLVYLYPLASMEAALFAARTANLRREVELARLRALLAPHFVRNALNVIAGLVTADPERADELLTRLGELLSELGRDEENHSLAREFAWLRAYAALFEARHPDLLSFQFELDARAERIVVPRLLLQPLVENAVLHGALAREGGGRVRVVVEKIDSSSAHSSILCTVEDDGPGMRAEMREGGLGVRLVRERLAACAVAGRLTYASSSAGTRAALEFTPEGPL